MGLATSWRRLSKLYGPMGYWFGTYEILIWNGVKRLAITDSGGVAKQNPDIDGATVV